MRFKIHDDEVDIYNAVFEDDYLDRIPISRHLTQIVDRIQDPLVIALDGPWGSGKSYFLKRWAGAHTHQNNGAAKVIYFDAFSRDYLSDPLTSLVMEISAHSANAQSGAISQLRKFTYQLAKPAAKVALAIATAGASELVGNIADAGLDALQEASSTSLDKFWEQESGRHHAMIQFRDAIDRLVTNRDGTRTPLVIVIDELDRCRPDYALEVLEVTKHLFNVDNVHFVLGANFSSLENSVKSRYGHEIDANRYLQKFVSFFLRLPDQFERSNEKTILRHLRRMIEHHGIHQEIGSELIDQVRILSRNNEISLRDINKICSVVSILPDGYMGNRYGEFYRLLFATILILQTTNPSLCRKLISLSLEPDELRHIFGASSIELEDMLEGGGQNPLYDHGLAYTFSAWEWLRSDGEPPRSVTFPADNPFGMRRFTDATKRLPQQIANELMSTIRV